MADPLRTRTTYFYELWRAGTAGILETAGSTFLLTIAMRAFSAGAIAKAAVAGAGSVGLLLSPVVVAFVTNRRWKTSVAAWRILAVGAASFFVAAAVPVLPVFVACSVVGMASSAAIIPLLTQMYQDNYPEKERGRRFSRTVMIRIAMAALFSKVAGDALSGGRLEGFRWLLVVFGGALGFASFCLSRCPTEPIAHDGGAHKCTLCYDRLQDGMEPACAKACPTDSIQFGPLDELVATARERCEHLVESGVESARLYGDDPDDGIGGFGAFFLLLDDPEVYGLPPDPVVTTRNLGQIWGAAAAAAGLVGATIVGAIALAR